MRNMRDEAVAIANAETPGCITGHILGGILAELVCSETGIPGASFAALGAFDPYSQADQELGNTSYNGLVENNMHQNTAFEVVLNTYDIASAIASIDGSACSHITSSYYVRWLWFGIASMRRTAAVLGIQVYTTRSWRPQSLQEVGKVTRRQRLIPH